ncbi:MAG: hypothetical protein RIS76_1948 [Verrucomicrobiota bacterium]
MEPDFVAPAQPSLSALGRETALPPCVVFEDDDLLVVNKPPGWNTHAPAPFSGEGIHEWFKHREPRWARLAIVHRLDKDTSGLLVFGKTPEANRSLTEQFARRRVHKHYQLVTDRPVRQERFTVRSSIVRVGDRYVSQPPGGAGDPAETHFRLLRKSDGWTWMEAEPVTGRTHQIRVHAAGEGWPILGDPLYGGGPAGRLHLHAARLELAHPRTGAVLVWEVAPDFSRPPGDGLRAAIIDQAETTAFRAIHGAADGAPGEYGERLGGWILVEGEGSGPSARSRLPAVSPAETGQGAESRAEPVVGVYFKQLRRQIRQTTPPDVSPRLLTGQAAPARFEVRENGLRFELSFTEGYSTGLFLDQRDNRRRLLTRHVAAAFPLLAREDGAGELLNCFAYTCAFSVCGAAGGMRTTSLDLSRKYLDWGRRNFALNGLDSAAHDFIYGDVFEWLQRLAKKGRRFQTVVLDPPTFSRSREHGDFRAESDYADLVSLALPLLASGGVLLASTNAARLLPERFVTQVRSAVTAAGRRVLLEHYVPQPPDFPVTREEPAHLKTLWMRIG